MYREVAVGGDKLDRDLSRLAFFRPPPTCTNSTLALDKSPRIWKNPRYKCSCHSQLRMIAAGARRCQRTRRSLCVELPLQRLSRWRFISNLRKEAEARVCSGLFFPFFPLFFLLPWMRCARGAFFRFTRQRYVIARAM